MKQFVKRWMSGLLCAVLMTAALSVGAYAAAGKKVLVKTIKEYAADDHYNVPDEFLDALSGKKSITQSKLKSLAEEHQLSSEFLQLFYDDHFVFKSGNKYELIPVDTDLDLHDYDWDNLKYKKNGEVQYVKDGKLHAVKGIDVSTYQGNIDWERVADDGVKFAYIRLGYRGYGTGKMKIDEKYHRNMEKASEAGIQIGVYFYSQAVTTKEARAEAKTVLKYIEDYDVDLPIAFDIENAPSSNARTNNLTADERTDITLAFCEEIEDAGYEPIIYSYPRMLTTQLDVARLEGYDKWVASYYKQPFYPYQFQILQYTSKGKVDGISGNVDMNLCFVKY